MGPAYHIYYVIKQFVSDYLELRKKVLKSYNYMVCPQNRFVLTRTRRVGGHETKGQHSDKSGVLFSVGFCVTWDQ